MKLINLQTFTVNRANPSSEGEYDDNGNYIGADQATASFPIQGSLQPATGLDMKLLPEGFKRTDTRKLFTTSELKTVNEDLNTEADTVLLSDGEYQVQVVEPWAGRKLSHYRVLIVKKEKQ